MTYQNASDFALNQWMAITKPNFMVPLASPYRPEVGGIPVPAPSPQMWMYFRPPGNRSSVSRSQQFVFVTDNISPEQSLSMQAGPSSRTPKDRQACEPCRSVLPCPGVRREYG